MTVHWLALFIAGTVSALSLPLWRKVCLRRGLVDSPGQRKIHLEPIPLAGGWAVLTGILLPWCAGWVWVRLGLPSGELKPMLMSVSSPDGRLLVAVLGGMVGMFLVGWADDRWELSPAWKFSGQTLVALGMVAAGVRTTLFGLPPWLTGGISVLWILTIVNAFNFSDNMNGLCAGLGTIAGLCLGLRFETGAQPMAATLALMVTGAALGFLPWNFPKATAFLGDAGSHALGALLAALSVLWEHGRATDVSSAAKWAPLLVLGVPLLDLVWVVLRRTWARRPFYVGDTNHLSHQLVRRGLSRAQAVVVLWGLGAGLGGFALWMRS